MWTPDIFPKFFTVTQTGRRSGLNAHGSEQKKWPTEKPPKEFEEQK